VFEFTCDELGAQSGLGGGGRYDGLVAEMGGPETAAVGWAAGIERILLALNLPAPEPAIDVFVVAAEGQRERAMAAVTELRRAGYSADLDLAGRSAKGQMKQADRTGAARAVVLGDEGGARLRDMKTGEEREIALGGLLEALNGV
jgi:histidyl-tRNA synthetase